MLHCCTPVHDTLPSCHAEQGRSWSNLTIIKSAKCGPTCNPHAVWSSAARKLVVTFMSHKGIAALSTPDPTGRTGWTSPTSLEPWLGKDWASKGYPGPGVAIAIALPNGGERLLFVAHVGPYLQDVVFFSDDSGATFNVSSSTPYVTKDNVLKGMNEAAFAQLSNGSLLLVMRNFGGKKEPPRFKNGTRPLSHNPLCADNGICKAFSRSDDAGAHWSNVDYFGTVRSGSCEAGVLGRNGSLYISVGDSDAPPNTGRMRMTLHRSRDDGASWHNMALLDPNNSAYSQLVTLKSRPGEIGVLWEALSPDKWFIGEMRLQWLPS